jgi:hypothetical protein
VKPCLFVVPDKERRHLAGNLPVPVDKERCPDCDGNTVTISYGEQALFIHGGYGATRTSVLRHCAAFCGWGVTESVTETNPRR